MLDEIRLAFISKRYLREKLLTRGAQRRSSKSSCGIVILLFILPIVTNVVLTYRNKILYLCIFSLCVYSAHFCYITIKIYVLQENVYFPYLFYIFYIFFIYIILIVMLYSVITIALSINLKLNRMQIFLHWK